MPANSRTPFGVQFTRGNILGVVETNDTSRLAVNNQTSTSSYRLTERRHAGACQQGGCQRRNCCLLDSLHPGWTFRIRHQRRQRIHSTYGMSATGELALVNAKTVDTGGPFSLPIDSDISADGKFFTA